MIRFYLGLWSSKFLLLILKILKQDQDDKPGLLAYRFCDNFLEKLAKPKTVVAITGTNGKSTVSSLIANLHKEEGKKVCYNDWGANCLAGHTRCLIDAVTIFNKPRVDVAVLETDELTSIETLPAIKPNYLIVTNISRDSIRRNANTNFIFDRLNQAISMIPKTKLILNADCPISSYLGEKNKKVFFGVKGDKVNKTKYLANDFGFCPKCYGKIEYQYKHYRHIGKFKCLKCDLKSYDANYLVESYDKNNKTMIVSSNTKKLELPIVSSSIFNIYNQIAVVSYFKELKTKNELLKENIKKIAIPKSRESKLEINGIELITQMAKGQNVSACSTVFEELSKTKEDIALVFLMNEMYGKDEGMETITWFYETEFEFLNKKNIKQILVGGPRYLDYDLRLKLAGLDPKKCVCIEQEEELCNHINYKDVKKIYFLHEVEAVSKGIKIRDQFYNKIAEKEGITDEN